MTIKVCNSTKKFVQRTTKTNAYRIKVDLKQKKMWRKKKKIFEKKKTKKKKKLIKKIYFESGKLLERRTRKYLVDDRSIV